MDEVHLETARPWRIKESAGELWKLTDRKESLEGWYRLLEWTPVLGLEQ